MSDDATSSSEPWEVMNENIEMISGGIPWGRRMGFRFTRIEKGHVWGLQPWKERLVGDLTSRSVRSRATRNETVL